MLGLNSLIFIAGAILGSFLNVCIYRVPRGISLIKPRSYCPSCKKTIPIFFNIPILSWIALRGKCSTCKATISLRYPLVEALAGLLALVTFWRFGLTGQFPFYTVFIYFLIVISFIDIDTKLILNKLLVLMLATGIILNFIFGVISWNDGLLGILAGGALMLSIGLIGKLILRKESLGMGDVKLAAVAGYFLGWKMILLSTFFGFFLSLPVLLVLMFFGKLRFGQYVPLGPFLALALITFVYWGEIIVQWYWNMFVVKPI
jgi:leader peptidase (prepilin peptidase) / N-methyltransferase